MNNFSEYNIQEHGDADCTELCEDLLQLTSERGNLVIDLGCGDYYGRGEPMEEIKDNYEEIFWEVILDTINRLKTEMRELGVHTTDNFIFFYCDHDQSYEERDKMIAMTVDEKMVKNLREATVNI